MSLTMRPTGGHSPVYADRQDWTILDEGKLVGRIYEGASASTAADLRWFWSIILYVDPQANMVTKRSLTRRSEVRFRGQTGKHLLASKLSSFDSEATSVLLGTNWPVANLGQTRLTGPG
jgi:hypothetical protein